MDGVHDLGGMEGFGPVPVAADQGFEDFAEWEKRMWGLSSGPIAPGITIDWFRHGVELMVPADYLTFAYFNKWCTDHLMFLLDNGMVTLAEVLDGHVARTAAPAAAMTLRDVLEEESASDTDYSRAIAAPPRFAPGEAVQTRQGGLRGHDRLPRYARGAQGRVLARHGGHADPTEGAKGRKAADHLYTVVFAAPDLWGAEADPRDEVTLDIWERDLVPA